MVGKQDLRSVCGPIIRFAPFFYPVPCDLRGRRIPIGTYPLDGAKGKDAMPPIPELEAIRKSQILQAALNTIAANGCANVTMADICKSAGLSKGGLAHYYKSKRDLFLAAFKAFFQQIYAKLFCYFIK